MTPKENWWREAVIYQVYPRSFQDSNGDGVGDLPGVLSRIDYIASLGVDVIWLNPFFRSPNDDGGYDISDYYDVQPEFGTLADFDELVREAHHRNLRIVIDLVFNHTSDEHEWFQASRRSVDNPYRNFYFWRNGRSPGVPPSNWPSFFGGSAWEHDPATDQYYLHLFSRKQPDLNWENPEVRERLRKIIRFWLNRGVDGIRLDVISAVSKRTDFPDADTADFNEIIARYYANGPRLQEYLRELREQVFPGATILTVGEGPGITPENVRSYMKAGEGLDMIFHFGHMFLDQGPGGRFDPVPWTLQEFREVFRRWDEALYPGGWGSIFLGNHDFARQVSRWGDDGAFREASAKALLTLLMTLRGTPFVFAGDELGMTNLKLDRVDESRDVETINGFRQAAARGMSEADFLKAANQSGRDNARSPFQWDSGKNAGFTTGNPWMKINDNAAEINCAAQEEQPDSVLNYFRRLTHVRKTTAPLLHGDLLLLDTGNRPLFAFDRSYGGKKCRMLINFSGAQVPVDDLTDAGVIVLDNYGQPDQQKSTMRPWEAMIRLM